MISQYHILIIPCNRCGHSIPFPALHELLETVEKERARFEELLARANVPFSLQEAEERLARAVRILRGAIEAYEKRGGA